MPDSLPPLADPADILRLIEDHQRFAVIAHLRPDGDAIGSQLGLGLALEEAGKDVLFLNEDGVPGSLAFLPSSDQVIISAEADPERAAAVEVVFALDTGNQERLGSTGLAILPKTATWVNIDHHVSNTGYGDLNYIDATAPATGEIIHRLLAEWGIPLTADGRGALFAAISTDTGSFRYPSTTDRTLGIAAELVRDGVKVGAMSESLYDSFPLRRLELTRELFKTLELECDGRVASWMLMPEIAKDLGIIPSDAEGLIDTLRGIDVVELAMYFEAMPDGKVRLSARSKEGGPDVCELCAAFGGGGHHRAAGARLTGPVDEARERVIKHVTKTYYGNT